MLRNNNFKKLIRSNYKILSIVFVLILLLLAYSFFSGSYEIVLKENLSAGDNNVLVSSSSNTGNLNAECSVDNDCNDNNPCTTDSCASGKCINSVNPFIDCVMPNGEMAVCNQDGVCTKIETYCDNGIDDDGDGLTDCADLDCEGAPCSFNGTVGACSDGICSFLPF